MYVIPGPTKVRESDMHHFRIVARLTLFEMASLSSSEQETSRSMGIIAQRIYHDQLITWVEKVILYISNTNLIDIIVINLFLREAYYCLNICFC